MKKHLFTILTCATAMVASHSCRAQRVVANRDAFGHFVFTEGDDSKPQQPKAQPARSHAVAPAAKASSAPTPHRSRLVYWSRKEHRWKPVPGVSPSTMRAAHRAAREVDTAILRENSRALRNSAPVVPGEARPAPATPAIVSQAIEAAARRHGVDPNLVRAMVKVESNFNPHAVSRKGAMGLMQLMPATAKSMHVGNAFDPTQNVDAGVRHFKSLLENYNGNLELSLAAYNAGSGAVDRSGGIPPYRETRDYVKRITELYWNSAYKPKVQESRNANGHRVFSNNDF